MCDTWVALPDATASRQVIFAKNSDRPIFDCQPLVYYPARDWPAGSTIDLEYLTLPQVDHTYANLGSSPYWCWGYEEGINEHSLVIGNEAIFTKTFREAAAQYQAENGPKLGLLGMDLIRLALEQAKTAAEAVQVMGDLIERYGQFGSGVPTKNHAEGGYDNSFIIADPSEAWTLEAVGTRWAARRFEQGTTSISNQPTIRREWQAGSPDIEAYARQNGWWQGGADEPFDFARAYIDQRVPRQLSQLRLMRSRQLLAERAGRVDPAWMKRIARDHYEQTFLGGPAFDPADPDFQTICMHVSQAGFTWGNTASSCVAALPKTADGIPVFWWTPGPPCNGCYVPFFVQAGGLPDTVSTAGRCGKRVSPPPATPQDEYDAGSYWWRFRRLLDRVKGDAVASLPGYYPQRNRLVRDRFDPLEAEFAAALPGVLAKAANAQAAGESIGPLLAEFSAGCVQKVGAVLDELAEMLA